MPKESVLFILFILAPLIAGLLYARLSERGIRQGTATFALFVMVIVVLVVCILLLAKLFNSNTLGWLFGLSLIFGLPLLILFGIGFAVGSTCKRRMHMPQAALVAQPLKPRDGLICNHLRPVEHAMRSAGLEVRAETLNHLHTDCRIRPKELSRRLGPAAAALYEEERFIDLSQPNSRSAFFRCVACQSHLTVVHPDEAHAATPWFPAASESGQALRTSYADYSW